MEIRRLQEEIDLAQSRYANALDKEENTRLAMSQAESTVRRTYFLIDAPTLPVEPVTSIRRVAQSIAIFGAVGAMLSLLAVVGGALLDRTVRFPLDLEATTDVTVLAMVPASDQQRRAEKKRRRVKTTETAPAPSQV